MSELNCEGLIPPFVEYLVSRATKFDEIVLALDERAVRGGIIFHSWWEDGAIRRMAIINELDDLRSVKTAANAYFVVRQREVDQVAEWDRQIQLGLEYDRQIKEQKAADLLAALTPLELLQLSSRVLNALLQNGLVYVEDVFRKTDDELRALRNFGKTSYDELRKALIEKGFANPDSEVIQFLKEARTLLHQAVGVEAGHRDTPVTMDDHMGFPAGPSEDPPNSYRGPQTYEVTNPPSDGN